MSPLTTTLPGIAWVPSYESVLVSGRLLPAPTIKSFSNLLKWYPSPGDPSSSTNIQLQRLGGSINQQWWVHGIKFWHEIQLDRVKQDASDILWSANCWLSSLIQQQQPFTKLVKNSAYYRWVKKGFSIGYPVPHDFPPAFPIIFSPLNLFSFPLAFFKRLHPHTSSNLFLPMNIVASKPNTSAAAMAKPTTTPANASSPRLRTNTLLRNTVL